MFMVVSCLWWCRSCCLVKTFPTLSFSFCLFYLWQGFYCFIRDVCIVVIISLYPLSVKIDPGNMKVILDDSFDEEDLEVLLFYIQILSPIIQGKMFSHLLDDADK